MAGSKDKSFFSRFKKSGLFKRPATAAVPVSNRPTLTSRPEEPLPAPEDTGAEYEYATVRRVADHEEVSRAPQPLPQDLFGTQNRDSTCTYAYIPVSVTERSEVSFSENDEEGDDGEIVSVDYCEVPSEIYCKPPMSEKALFASFRHKKYHRIPRHSVRSLELIGQGQFGTVHKGILQTSEGPKDCAMKMLHEGSSSAEKVRFLQEAAIIGQFYHPAIVRLWGVVLKGDPVVIVLELLPGGDLRHYLQELSISPGKLSLERQDHTQRVFLSFARQVAAGMNYLANKGFIHRDLAARNILMADQHTCKIGDFGMSRDLMDEDLYKSRGGQIPIRWTSIEAIEYREFSTASDVWSFGVLLFEIWSLGEKPFSQYTPQEGLGMIKEGKRLPPPPGCPRAIYQLMMHCWHPVPSGRLSFMDVVFRLSYTEDILLQWDQVDEGMKEATTLGARLSLGESLHRDVQQQYLTSI